MAVKTRVFALLALGLLGMGVLKAYAATTPVPSAPDIEVFMREGYPACSVAIRFLDDLQRERPALRIIYSDVRSDPQVLARLQALAEQRGVQALGVPAFFLRGELHIGYVSADTTGERLRGLLDRPASQPGALEAAGPASVPESIDVPLLGRLRLGGLSLPAVTLVLDLLDGFNPCAMWVLLGGTFVAVSGLVYFAFMAAWLNLFLLIGLGRVVQVALGDIAVLVGVINVKDGFAVRYRPSLTIPEAAKPGLYARAAPHPPSREPPGCVRRGRGVGGPGEYSGAALYGRAACGVHPHPDAATAAVVGLLRVFRTL